MPPQTMTPLITGLDHVLIHATDLDAAAADYVTLLGRPVVWRGERDGLAAAMVGSGGLRILLTRAETDGLAGLGFRVGDMSAMRRRVERLGMSTTDNATGDGGFSLAPEAARGLRFSFSEAADTEAATPAEAGAVQTLDHVVINTGDGEATASLFGARLGLDLRAVVANPKWGARLYFFRCGGSVVELAHRSESQQEPARDAFSGLAWRVDDAAALQVRLAAAGVNVSEVRDGRKPGTKVFTVRDHTAGVPTLVIQQAPRSA